MGFPGVNHWALVACLLMALSAYCFRPGQDEGLALGLGFMLSGGIAFGFALRKSNNLTLTPEPVTANSTRVSPMRLLAVAPGVICLVLLALSSGGLLRLPVNLQFGLLVGGIALWLWAFGGIGFSRPDRWLALITLAGLLARVWALEDAVHFFVDETNFVDAVIHLKNDDQTKLLTPFSTLTAFTWVYPYLQSLSTNVFGHSLTGMRVVSAVIGTLTIPALYLLAKYLFDRKTALLAALFLATFPPHVHLSRLGLNNIADPLFGTLALAFLARGARTQRPADYALSGAALGLTQYFYEGGRLLFPALVGLCLLGMAATRRASWRGAALLLLSAVVTVAPLYYTYLAHRLPLVPRLNSNTSDNAFWTALMLASTDDPVLHLVNRPDGSGFYYGGGTPLILGYLVPVFLLGIFHVFWRRKGASALLFAWVLFTVRGNSFLKWNDWTPRFAVVFPALCLLMAAGLRCTLPLILPNRTQGFKPLVGSMGAVAVALAIPQLAYYFGPHLALFNLQIREWRDHRMCCIAPPNSPPVHTCTSSLASWFSGRTLKR